MARALIQGLLRNGFAAPQLRVGEPVEAQRAALARDYGVTALADNRAVVTGAALVVLAVKPQQVPQLLADLAPTLAQQQPLLLSIAAGLRVADLAAHCPGLPIVRAMPNRAALVGAGATALYATPAVDPAARALAAQVCGVAGLAVWVERESDLDIVTALSGSGPAYFFLLAEHLATAATAMGLDSGAAQLLARQTLCGAGALAAGTMTLAEQRDAVTSRGGTTAAALAALQAGGFDKLVAAAVAAGTQRSTELAMQFGRPQSPGNTD